MFRIGLLILGLIVVSTLRSQRLIPVGTGIDSAGIVFSLHEYDGKLIIGGNYSVFNNNASPNIQAWDGQEAYSMLGAFSDEDDVVYALIGFEGELIAAGRDPDVGHIARWNGTSWESMGTGYPGNFVRALVVYNDELYAGGSGGRVLKWTGTEWLQIGVALASNEIMTVTAMAEFNGDLYVGGSFTNRMVRLDDGAWETIGDFNGSVQCFAIVGSDLFVGGFFTSADPGSMLDPYWVKYDGSAFTAPDGPVLTQGVQTLVPMPNGGMIVCRSGYQTLLIANDAVYRVLMESPRTGYIMGNELFIGGSSTIVDEDDMVLGMVVEGVDVAELNMNSIHLEVMNEPWWFGIRRMAGTPTFTVEAGGVEHSLVRDVAPFLFGVRDEQTYFSVPFSNGSTPCYGPYVPGSTTEQQQRYDQVWRVDRLMIEHHIAHWSDPDHTIPYAIKSWPGNGASGLGEPTQLAPYADLDDDGLYEPQDGEYPQFRGDQAIYYIQHDAQGWMEERASIERHIMHYVFWNSWDEHLANTVFTNIKLIDRSLGGYANVHFGLLKRLQIGNELDDVLGSDSTLHLSYIYNHFPFDQSALGVPGFEASPPALGVAWLNSPLTVSMRLYQPSGPDPFPGSLNPDTVQNLLQGLALDGTPFYDPYGFPTSIAFTGDPASGTGWNDTIVSPALPPKLYFSGIGPVTIPPGDTLCIDLAWIYARDSVGGHLASVTKLKEYTAQIRQWYQDNGIQCNGSYGIVTGEPERTKQPGRLLVHPNPAQDLITLTGLPTTATVMISIHNVQGQVVLEGRRTSNDGSLRMDISQLRSGWYTIAVRGSKGLWHAQLVIAR